VVKEGAMAVSFTTSNEIVRTLPETTRDGLDDSGGAFHDSMQKAEMDFSHTLAIPSFR
jgi:hypothetical protein